MNEGLTWNAEALTGLGVPEEVASKVMQAHEEAMAEMRSEMIGERSRRRLAEKLQEKGVQRDAAVLAAATVHKEQMKLDEEGKLRNEEALVEMVRKKYPSLFPEISTCGSLQLNPPVQQGGALDIAQMSAADINRNWAQVQEMLAAM